MLAEAASRKRDGAVRSDQMYRSCMAVAVSGIVARRAWSAYATPRRQRDAHLLGATISLECHSDVE
jgi:hypothetical protein